MPSFRGVSSRKMPLVRKNNPQSRRFLRLEPLEERRMLAVDVLGRLGDFGALGDDHDSSCVSHISYCETTCLDRTTHVDETALVSQRILEETAQYYRSYFADENYSPIRPMVFDDWVVYDAFSTWKAEVDAEIFASICDFFSQNHDNIDNIHGNVDPAMVQQALEALPPPRMHGKIVPPVFGKTPFLPDWEDDDGGGVMHTMSGSCGTSGVPYRSGWGLSLPSVIVLCADNPTVGGSIYVEAGYGDFVNPCNCQMTFGVDTTNAAVATVKLVGNELTQVRQS